MTQEDKELLLKDLSYRIPYGVIVNVNGISNAKLITVSWYGEVGVDDSTNLYSLSEVKPYLFPLSSMTEEQHKEWLYTLSSDYHITYDTVDWCNKNHFDYRGLIEKGLAIDATGLNIY